MNLALNNRQLLLILTGGIAAYKIPELVRRLTEQGAQVRVVMTEGAQAFITPLTLQAVSGNPVHQDLLDSQAEAAMGHIELAKWADLVVVAPASANAIAQLALGQANDLMGTLCLATAAPIAIAPAMNQQMWAAPAVQRNIRQLEADGRLIWGPGVGSQACGDVGAGRMLEPHELLARVQTHFKPSNDILLAGEHWVITAGPTREALDPVRYLTNVSSGKMGYALAEAAAAAGAEVSLISGPVQLPKPTHAQIECIDVISADDMLEAVQARMSQTEVFIGCAAVADFKAAEVQTHKIKKQTDTDFVQLTLVKNPDILAWVAAQKEKPFVVGFAAETQQVAAYAQQKLIQKNADMIIANDVSQKDIGFHSEDNAAVAYWFSGQKKAKTQQQAFKKQSKKMLANELIKLIAHHKREKHEEKSASQNS